MYTGQKLYHKRVKGDILFYEKMSFNTYVKKQVVEEIHKQTKIKFKRRREIINGLNDRLQTDLVDM